MTQAYQELSQATPPSDTVLTIGVFDGVHRGHQHLIQQVRREALARGRLAGVVTFRNHPLAVLRPEAPLLLLTTFEERLRLLEAQEIDLVVPLTFDLELSRLRARQFCALLQEKLRMRGLVVGPTFAMGFQREGTPEVLQTLGQEMGFTVRVVDVLLEGEERVSSTALRRVLGEGNVTTASRYLGHPFALEGIVARGEGRGRDLGFPTANLEVAPDLAVPGDGIYATWAYLEGDGRWKAATSIGVRPTFGEGRRTIEAFLIGFQGDLYGRRLRLEFTHRLRDELHFDSVEALVRQMHEDVRHAERLLDGAEAAD
ncbi:MAG: bifunctional riboflavin kinase/FAD synthetase [Dehalococcoidia bacterium]|nr:bifunctional riboflavin kinase/FAD synthetase [Dehalococcoidia bacterium]